MVIFLKLLIVIITILSRENLIKKKKAKSHRITCVSYFTYYTAFKFMFKKSCSYTTSDNQYFVKL